MIKSDSKESIYRYFITNLNLFLYFILSLIILIFLFIFSEIFFQLIESTIAMLSFTRAIVPLLRFSLISRKSLANNINPFGTQEAASGLAVCFFGIKTQLCRGLAEGQHSRVDSRGFRHSFINETDLIIHANGLHRITLHLSFLPLVLAFAVYSGIF